MLTGCQRRVARMEAWHRRDLSDTDPQGMWHHRSLPIEKAREAAS